MVHSVPDALLDQLAGYVAAHMGLHFPRERQKDLGRGISAAAREFNFKDAESCIRWLISAPLSKHQIEVLASHLTVGETYFYRDKAAFAFLEETIFPELIRSRCNGERRLRVWSAGCASGEEPYSIAILLSRMISAWKEWNPFILATDINPQSLQKASAGIYSNWSFRDCPSWLQTGCFKKNDEGHFGILPHLRRRVTFSYLNLAEDVYPSVYNNTNAMDVVICRNVLMYFTPERAKQVIDKLHRSLIDGGWLIISPSEASQELLSQFVAVPCGDTIVYRKARRAQTIPTSNAFPKFEDTEQSTLPSDTSLCKTIQEYRLPLESSAVEAVTAPVIYVDYSPRTLPDPSPKEQAQRLYMQGDYERAGAILLSALEKEPDDAEFLTLLARCRANQGSLTEAVEWCEKAIAIDRLNPASHFLRAMILQERGATEDAVQSFRSTLYLDQEFVPAHFALGSLARMQGKKVEAARHFQNALSLLSRYRPEEIVREFDGMTAGRLIEVIRTAGAIRNAE